MKRFFALFFATLVACAGMMVSAEVISQEIAKQTADNFLSLDSEWQGAGDATLRLVEKDGVPAYYVVEYENGGWAVVSAQSSAMPVVGYNPTGVFESPEPMQAVLNAYASRVVDEARAYGDEQHVEWKRIMQRKPAVDPNSTPDVAPLIVMDLNQSAPFNTECPMVDGQHVLVGCVAVGMGQAMMKQRYPLAPQGKHSYKSNDEIGYLSIDYDKEAEYDWDAIYASQSTGNYDELARLLYHCGVSANMDYGLYGSGTYEDYVPEALVDHFKYDESLVKLAYKDKYDGDWLGLILDDIYLGRVVLYFGDNGESGHCWNLDGWKQSTQMVHVNWGWGGVGNGYFKIDAMQDQYQGMSFPLNNSAIMGVGAPTTAPYGIKLSKTTFTAGTAAGVALADVIVSCEDKDADLEYEILGPKNVLGKHSTSPYSVQDGKLVASETVQDANKFKYMHMTVTNKNTGESFTKEFTMTITTNGEGAVDAVMSDAMRVYPSVASENITIEVPVVGGEYAIYSVSGVQVLEGTLSQYKNSVDVSSLTAGTYILRYVHNDGVGVKTFIKR